MSGKKLVYVVANKLLNKIGVSWSRISGHHIFVDRTGGGGGGVGGGRGRLSEAQTLHLSSFSSLDVSFLLLSAACRQHLKGSISTPPPLSLTLSSSSSLILFFLFSPPFFTLLLFAQASLPRFLFLFSLPPPPSLSKGFQRVQPMLKAIEQKTFLTS